MTEKEELKKAIETARRVHDRMTGPADGTCVILGALIRAVEILAGERDIAEKVETTSGTCAFSDELVERMHQAYFDAMRLAPKRDKSGVLTVYPKVGFRAVLSELAKAPVELPSDDEVGRTWSNSAHEERDIVELFRVRIAPMITAKDAKIAEQAKRIVELEKDARVVATQKELLLVSIEELKKDAEEKHATAHAHIVSLEKRLGERSVESTKELRDKTIALDESNSFMNDAGVPYSHLTCERVRMLIESRDAACAKLAELTAPMVVDGKTPGQVSREARRMATLARVVPFYDTEICDGKPVDNDAIEEYAAREVLRAFGAEALRRVLGRWNEQVLGMSNQGMFTPGQRNSFTITLRHIIDDELAKLGQTSVPFVALPTRSLCDSARSVMHYVLLNAGRPETERWKEIYDATLKLQDEVKKVEGES